MGHLLNEAHRPTRRQSPLVSYRHTITLHTKFTQIYRETDNPVYHIYRMLIVETSADVTSILVSSPLVVYKCSSLGYNDK
jgi:hypothetical protein